MKPAGEMSLQHIAHDARARLFGNGRALRGERRAYLHDVEHAIAGP